MTDTQAIPTDAEPPVPPTEPATATKWSAATRYLCAAAHLDQAFTDRAIEENLDRPYRAFVPSYGVDLVPVLKHCLQARRRRTIRDALLTVVALAALFYIARWLFLTLDPNRSAPDLWPGLVIPLAIAWVIDFAEWRVRSRALGQLRRERFKPDSIRLRPNARRKTRLKEIAEEQQRCNVVVYSGFSPFVGSGVEVVEPWSFVVDLSKGKDLSGKKAEPLPFEVEELYGSVKKDVLALKLEGLNVEDRLYANGLDIRGDERFQDGRLTRPHVCVSSSVMSRVMRAPTWTVRYHQCITITKWRGELVLSICLYFSKSGSSLYAKGCYFLLPPIHSAYHQVDMLSARTLRSVCTAVWEIAIATPAAVVDAPFRLGTVLFRPWARRRTKRKLDRAIQSDHPFNYGVGSSLRESAADERYHRYFQALDDEMYGQIVHHLIIDAIISFLDGRHVDTSEFRKRQNPWLVNFGVIMNDSNLSASNLAVGRGAQATGGAGQTAGPKGK